MITVYYKRVLASTLALALIAGLVGFAPFMTDASSHREAPSISGDPKADATDLYAFVSPDEDDTVTLIANYVPFQEPAGGPNFYTFSDDVLYEIKIDNDGDAMEDISYQYRFMTTIANPKTFLYNTGAIMMLGATEQNVKQVYSLTKVEYLKNKRGKATGKVKKTELGTNLPIPPSNIGPKSTPDYDELREDAVQDLDGTKSFVGQNDDPFFVDLGGIFDLLTIRKLPGNDGGGVDGLAGYSVQSLALQIPIEELTKNKNKPTDIASGDSVIGVWTTASRAKESVLRNMFGMSKKDGEWMQVSRLGAPLVNEVVLPLGQKDIWNASKPADDAQFANYVTNPELAGLFKALYNIQVPPQADFGKKNGRDDLVAIFLTGIKGLTQPTKVKPSEQLRLNVAVPVTEEPNSLGVVAGDNQGYPNGRRLADDVVDISLKAVAGAAYPLFHPDFTPDPLAAQLGDGVDANDMEFDDEFPYLASPVSGFDSMPHARAMAAAADETEDDAEDE